MGIRLWSAAPQPVSATTVARAKPQTDSNFAKLCANFLTPYYARKSDRDLGVILQRVARNYHADSELSVSDLLPDFERGFV